MPVKMPGGPGSVVFLSWRDTGHPDGGGSEVYVEEVAKRLAAAGHRVTIVCAAHETASGDRVRDGVHYRHRGGRLTVYLHGLGYLLSRRGRTADLVVDVVNGLPFGSPIVRRHGLVALVHHVHRAQWRIIYPGLAGRIGWLVESRLTPWLYRDVPHITVSEATRRDLVALGVRADLLEVVHNGTPPRLGASGERARVPTLCVLSRLVPHKQIQHAVEVLAALAPVVPGLTLHLIGDGWWSGRIRERIDALAVSGRVIMHGHVDEPTKSALLDQAWLMLLPSVKEGWGISVLEAAAHGTPTIAYRSAGGVEESVLHERTGLLVEDQEELRARTLELLRDPPRLERLANAARLHAAGFSWDVTAEAFARRLDQSRKASGAVDESGLVRRVLGRRGGLRHDQRPHHQERQQRADDRREDLGEP